MTNAGLHVQFYLIKFGGLPSLVPNANEREDDESRDEDLTLPDSC